MEKQITENTLRVSQQVDCLMLLAMTNREKLHIAISFKPHVNWVDCRVVHPSRNYENPEEEGNCLLFTEFVRLGEHDALDQLLALEDKIVELLGDVNV